jgi:hypothetical protein
LAGGRRTHLLHNDAAVCKSNLPVFIISTQKFGRENLELKYVDSLVARR